MNKNNIKNKTEELKKVIQNKELYIQFIDGIPTNTGRSDYFKILILDIKNKYKKVNELNLYYYADVLGYRYNKKHNSINITGYGYSKSEYLKALINKLNCNNVIFEM